MISPDYQIHYWARNHGITPFDEACVNPASIDLRLGDEYRVPEGETWSEPQTIPRSGLHLLPGSFILCHTLETVKIPNNLVGKLFLKSSAGRRGLEHLHAGYIDPGFEGQLTLELINHWPGTRVLMPGERLLQLTLEECQPCSTPYGEKGRYQHQTGATPTR